jgi:hypothetical protein
LSRINRKTGKVEISIRTVATNQAQAAGPTYTSIWLSSKGCVVVGAVAKTGELERCKNQSPTDGCNQGWTCRKHDYHQRPQIDPRVYIPIEKIPVEAEEIIAREQEAIRAGSLKALGPYKGLVPLNYVVG